MPSGQLPANKWTKVMWGWGWYEVTYTISSSAPGGQFRTYPIYSSGTLPRQVTHQVRGYGDVWLYSPVLASWQANPTGP